MKLIAHRGNIKGPNPKLENKPSYIDEALNMGYFVEVDIWYDKGWWLGHDEPLYKYSIATLNYENKLIHHAKNIEALRLLLGYRHFHSFWHQTDDYTLTSQGYIWVYPNRSLPKNSICVLPEQYTCPIEEKVLKKCYGICSDYISRYIDFK